MTCLLFIVRGTIHIYGVEPDGTQYSIVAAQEETILGVVEFLLDRPSPYFAQAACGRMGGFCSVFFRLETR